MSLREPHKRQSGDQMIAHNLPPQPTLFIGRTQELAEIDRILTDPACRLLTLVGPGGIGKTRLSLEAAAAHLSAFADGVYFVPLQSLSDADSIMTAVAEAMNFQFLSAGDKKANILRYLEPKQTLLLLDNFEHLLDGAEFVSEMLTAASGLCILITSRERLNLREEWVYEVGGLSVPAAEAAAFEGYSAVQLFAQNARRVSPGFSLDTERASIARICALVGGMPLALELAASWVRALSCTEIAAEIEHGLDILETSTRNVPERHRNMRAVLDHSWRLLSESERDALRKLSVFRGGFTREAVSAVAGASPRILSALVDKSWLRHADDGRYDLHELLRQYALERLEDSGLAGATLNAHANYFAEFMRAREIDIKFRRQAEALAEIERDFENVRLGWKWAVGRCDERILNAMLEAMNFYCDMRARFQEGEELFRYAAAPFFHLDSREARLLYMRLRARRARMIFLGSGAVPEGLDALTIELEAHLEEARQYESPLDIAFLLHIVGIEEVLHFNFKRGLARFEESYDVYTELNDPFYMAETLTWIGNSQTEAANTRRYFEEALAFQQDIGDINGIGWTLMHLGRAAFWRRDYVEAERFFEESMAVQRERGDLKGLHSNLIMASQRALRAGDFDRAVKLVGESYQIAHDLNLLPIRQSSLVTKGMLYILMETNIEVGQRLCREAIAMAVPRSFMMGDPHIEATSGLCVAAFLMGDSQGVQAGYREMLRLMPEFGYHKPQERFNLLIPLAILRLVDAGQLERAVELIGLVFSLNDQTTGMEARHDLLVIHWLERVPVMLRLREKLEQQLGTARYEAVLAQGRRLDFAATVESLLNPDDETSSTAPPELPLERDSLTEREQEILRLVADGLSNKQIADQLILSVGTVKWYISEIFSKLGVNSRTQAAARARALDLL